MILMILLPFVIFCIILSLSLINYSLLLTNNYNLDRKINFSKLNKILLILLIISLIIFTILTFNLELYKLGYTETNFLNYIPDGQSSSTPQDPVRWWPSGVPQSLAVIGTMAATFGALGRVPGATPRLRVLASLGAGGVTTSNLMYHSAIENSVGFNRFLWSISTYRQTGKWPSIDELYNPSNANPEAVNKCVTEAMSKADSNIVNKTVTEAKNLIDSSCSSNSSQFTSSNNNGDILYQLFDNLMQQINFLFKPVDVSGYFDDLIGQQIAIVFILLFTSIFLVLLILAYIVNNLLFYNKENIIKRFGQNNKFVLLYLKYQVFCIRLSLFYLPVFIFIGFFVLIHGLYFLITHQIPYENLGVDLHVFIKSR